MIYTFTNGIKEISIEEFSKETLTLSLMSSSEYKTFGDKFGTKQNCLNLKNSEIKTNYGEYIFSLEKASTNIDISQKDDIHICIDENLLLIIDSDKETNEIFINTITSYKSAISLDRLVLDYLSAVTYNDSKELDEIEMRISKSDDAVLTDGKIGNINDELLKIKRRLFKLRSFYEQLSDIGDELYKNENELFDEKKTGFFKDFALRMDKLASKVDLLRESLVQLREAYQASIDLKLNNTMKVFTVIATIFLPLTLITSWYGMNFNFMPELSWRYGYIYVIGISLVVAIGCIIYFKKKKLL